MPSAYTPGRKTWENLRQRALNVAMPEINAKTDLNIALESPERSRHRRITALIFAIKAQAASKGKRTG
jgi:plasmid replication initiation protein